MATALGCYFDIHNPCVKLVSKKQVLAVTFAIKRTTKNTIQIDKNIWNASKYIAVLFNSALNLDTREAAIMIVDIEGQVSSLFQLIAGASIPKHQVRE